MTDRITLTGLDVVGHHGVFAVEKEQGQHFVVDITTWLDLTPAARTDDVADTLHYGELAEYAAGVIAGPPRDLIETVAVEIAEGVLGRWPVTAVEVTLHKPTAPIPLTFADVSVTVRRTAAPGAGSAP
ncbi:dihydroneopterin aldolase [Nakamurella deserti]|uniref:dihydroneopterin aldolase n=1 Tax=Nakamurella deserti TaxID=2164074 RepID=UPI000DBEA8C9|nr:dihydroneopterin aldolase [Nakamurella deserti]